MTNTLFCRPVPNLIYCPNRLAEALLFRFGAVGGQQYRDLSGPRCGTARPISDFMVLVDPLRRHLGFMGFTPSAKT